MLINSNEFIAIDIYSEMVLDKYAYIRNLKMHNNWYQRIVDVIYYYMTYYCKYIKILFNISYTYKNLQILDSSLEVICKNVTYDNLVLEDSTIIIYNNDKKLCIPYENIAKFLIEDSIFECIVVGKLMYDEDTDELQLQTTRDYCIIHMVICDSIYKWLYSNSKSCFRNVKNRLYYHLKYNNFNMGIIDIYNNLGYKVSINKDL